MRLKLKRETLAEFTPVELSHVVGAAAPTIGQICSRPTLTLTCLSAVDGCVTAQICGL